MKASELRIGNYVKCDSIPEVGILKISVINKDFVNGCNIELIKPIALTEEWLLKFGFESEHNKKMFLKDKLTILIKKHDTFNPNGRVYWNSWVIKEFQPKYVHQLQNLYFALTNEELTYEQQK